MLTTNSVVVDECLMFQELGASLFYHPFTAQVPREAMWDVADALGNARFNATSYEDVLDEVTQILLKDKEVAVAHTGDEVAAIAYGMVQRVHEISAYPLADSGLRPSQLIC